MEEKFYKGRVFFQETRGVQGEDGYWKVEVDLMEKVTLKDGTELEEHIKAMAMDSTFIGAHQVALRSALAELQDLVYAKGFDSLIEGREYQRSLEAVNGGSKNNTTSITQ